MFRFAPSQNPDWHRKSFILDIEYSSGLSVLAHYKTSRDLLMSLAWIPSEVIKE